MLPSFFRAIGGDRFLTRQEAIAGEGDHALFEDAWSLYQGAFGGYCETRLDPQFHRFDHPATLAGSLVSLGADPVLVVGNGPSTSEALPVLGRLRNRLRIFTSPRGAELLATHGLVPDLVLVEHRAPIDAHHAARHDRDGAPHPLRLAPLVATDWRTPHTLVGDVASGRLFVPDPLPTWGLWPATAVALAATAGAARIGLLGIDLGTTGRPDPMYAPLTGLLGLLARLTLADTVDCGRCGARKPGWPLTTLVALEAGRTLTPLEVETRCAPSREERLTEAHKAHASLSPIVDRSRELLELGLRARRADRVRGLEAAVTELMSWRTMGDTRVDLQEALGLSFLPRMWRTGIDLGLGPALWRPLVLATHELVGQAERLEATMRRAAA